jgi:hypothetical protein
MGTTFTIHIHETYNGLDYWFYAECPEGGAYRWNKGWTRDDWEWVPMVGW